MKRDPSGVDQQGPKAPMSPGSVDDRSKMASGQGGTNPTSEGSAGSTGSNSASGGAARGSALLPAVAAPKGGGAIRGIGEKFSVNAATGTASLSIPIATSPGRSGFGPQLELAYDSGSGNGPFGIGFHLSAPAITRKTDKGLPRYWDKSESDVYVLAGAEDLVPVRDETDPTGWKNVKRDTYTAFRYRPRVEGAFSRIERCVDDASGAVHWRVTTRDNVTHIYGRSGSDTRIVDPNDEARIFSWLLEESRDDKGNVIRYIYKAEDGAGVTHRLSEKTRFKSTSSGPQFTATAQRYLKRILYGNRIPGAPSVPGDPSSPTSTNPDQYLFEVVFDYGEHDLSDLTQAYAEPTSRPWILRPDASSSFRSGFDVRTYRLCRHVLMFHRIESPSTPVLVSGTEFLYESSDVVTYLLGATHWGYAYDSVNAVWSSDHLPELTLEFQRAVIHDTLSSLPQASLEGLTGGIDGSRKQWVDLDGEGIPGVLIDAGSAWYYKSNNGTAKLTPPDRLATMPSPASLGGGVQTLEDIAGDGQLDLVQHSEPLSGFFTRTVDGDFEPLRTFQSIPNIDWNDPNLRFVDLDGDGLSDALITESDCFIWYRSHGKGGYDLGGQLPSYMDEDRGPAIVFADGTQTIQLADMSGDGLVDIVRVRNGEVCYWPNLGYGRFGAKITLEQSPVFAAVDEFDPTRVRFGDIDGSGTSDVVYLGSSRVTLYLNQSGNSLTTGQDIQSLPSVDNSAQVHLVDLLGQGMSSLVWSTPLSSPGSERVFYVDLMGGVKPHLLSTVINNLGAQTTIEYAPSTKFYLQDKASGNPWLTRLSFPVHVVTKITHFDAVSDSQLVSEYTYHHGFYDGLEREFRGFARVEQTDAETFSQEDPRTKLDQPPVLTKTWFHTGAWLEKERLEKALTVEYYPPGTEKDAAALVLMLPDTVYLPDDIGTPMSILDEREAARALRGHMLRQEIYALDGDPNLQSKPYITTEQSFGVKRLQASADPRRGIFFAHPLETLTIHTERNPSDPRVGHELILEVDDFGNVKRKASIAYGRKTFDADKTEQGQLWATLTETDFFNSEDPARPSVDWYRAGVQYEQRTYELTGFDSDIPRTGLAVLNALRDRLDNTTTPVETIEYQATPGSGPTKRLIEQLRQYFYPDTLGDDSLPLGTVQSKALPHQTYNLAFTVGMITNPVESIVKKSTDLTSGVNPLDPADLEAKGKYAHPTRPNSTNPTQQDPDPNYWLPSGRLIFDAAHFYLPTEAIDPFNQHHFVTYDAYSLVVLTTTDPIGNIVQAENDYRVLAPHLVTDPNLNRNQVVFDALGRVTALAVMGKDTTDASKREGDTVAHPTVRFEYHLDAIPAYVKTTAREQHFYPNQTDGPIQDSYTYSDGFGRIVQQKVQAEDGPVPGITGTVTNRWVGTGRTVYNNKGNPVKQYEPFFSQTSAYESEASIVEWGVTPIIHYDPLDRVIQTDLPNGTFSKVIFDAWQQENWDPNDTAHDPDDPTKDSAWYTARINGAMGTAEQRAAQLAAKHAKTPTTTYLDSLGRVFLSRADNGPDPATPNGVHRFYYTKSTLDIEGNQLAIMDARQYARTDGIYKNTIEQKFDVIGRRYQVVSADAGERLTLLDVAAKPVFTWDSRAQRLAHDYDEAQRPTHTRLRVGTTETVVARSVYGEALDSGAQNLNPNTPSSAQALNLRGQGYLLFDSAGLGLNDHFDFKGNLLSATRHIATAYQTTADWTSVPETLNFATFEASLVTSGLLEDTSTVQMRFTTQSAFDALNRVTSHTTPDGSVTTPTYNRANLLETVTVLQGTTTTRVIANIDYNEKGQRILCAHGEQTVGSTSPAYTVNYAYDPKTFRLTQITTRRALDNVKLQDLIYTYDPVGNIVALTDATPKTVIFDSSAVDASGAYEYDPLYRLIFAQGREHPGQQINDADPAITWTSIPHINDTTGITRYTEEYEYDQVGNITNFHHIPDSGTAWTRLYTYDSDNNRLNTASEPVGASPNPYPYTYNGHGSMTSMAHLPAIDWDFAERMQHANLRGGGDVYFVYDGTGERVRKVWVHNGTIDERIYLGGYEVYRRTSSTTLEINRQTLHVMDDTRRVAMFENTLADTDPTLLGIRKRFQLDNHLGSSMMEVDAQGNIITYEEYHPYGTTALNLKNDGAHFSQKRYRYTGKERDEETSLYYHGARYYAPWLGRWTAADPLGVAQPGKPDLNLYAYARGRVLIARDPSGMQEFFTQPTPEPVGTAANGGTMMSNGTIAPASIEPRSVPKPDVKDISYKIGKTEVKAYLIKGKTDKTALVFGGIHGSEKAGREIGTRLKESFNAGEAPEYTTILVPDIFGGTQNDRELPNGINPNRAFPEEGQPLRNADSLGREIPEAVKALIRLRDTYKPEQILQLHGIVVPNNPKKAEKKVGKPGVTTDVREGHETEDIALTKKMALEAAKGMKEAGLDPAKRMSGNALGTPKETFVYPTKEASAEEGVTAGMYFSHKTPTAPAANVVLIETYNNYTSRNGQDKARAAELNAYVNAIRNVFLRR